METTISRRALLATPLLLAGVPAVAKGQDAATAPAVGGVPMFRGNAARTGENPGPRLVGTPKWRWIIRLGTALSSSPVVVDGTIYIGSVSEGTIEGGALHAVAIKSGIERWRLATEPGDGIFATPAVGDGVVVTGSYDGIVIAADARTGVERWRFQAESTFYASPALVDGAVYLGDDSGHLYALDLATGEERWRFIAGHGFERGIASPSVANGVVYANSGSRRPEDDTYLLALDAETGDERWRFTPDAASHVAGCAILAEGRVYVQTHETLLYAVDQETGEERACHDLGVGPWTELAVSGGVGFFGADAGGFFAFDLETGERRWASRLNDGAPLYSSPVVVGDTVYVGDANGYMYAVTTESGEAQWSKRMGQLISTPAVVDGELSIGTSNGYLGVVRGHPESAPHQGPE